MLGSRVAQSRRVPLASELIGSPGGVCKYHFYLVDRSVEPRHRSSGAPVELIGFQAGLCFAPIGPAPSGSVVAKFTAVVFDHGYKLYRISHHNDNHNQKVSHSSTGTGQRRAEWRRTTKRRGSFYTQAKLELRWSMERKSGLDTRPGSGGGGRVLAPPRLKMVFSSCPAHLDNEFDAN